MRFRARLSLRTRIAVLAVSVALLAGQAGVAAQAPPPPPGARAYGMGGAFVAVAEGPAALHWNPATLGGTGLGLAFGGEDIQQIAELYALGQALRDWDPADESALDRFAGRPLHAPLSGLAAIGRGGLGIGIGMEATADANITSRTANLGGEERTVYEGSAAYRLLVPIRAGYGLELVDVPSVARLRAGASIAYYTGAAGTYWGEYDYNPPAVTYKRTVRELRASGYGVDVGLHARISPWVAVGAAAYDAVGQVTWSGTQTEYQADESGTEHPGQAKSIKEPDARHDQPSYRAGVAVTPPLLGLTVAADVDSDSLLHVGAEWKPLGLVAVRAGYIQPLDAGSAPNLEIADLRAGVGVALPAVALDAAVGVESDTWRVKDVMLEATLGF
ncbi:hypothetical protein [Limnochorda pilosa]|uniref:Uncharacterized protein n=1 Tax=Limnochorda pilosa TaxID=1555112 RepID=A0A0K2SHV5_LIMPI|nr:hypothetical protein [Limnochorda pilosa]BAS26696.1 hypothetical protein LIP_0839 [Limnochorda pilosa]